ncbi:MAG: secretin N-terminal domain-containing protein [Verrucomicrobiota bacterium]|nr:secretin N-terminal domain-containing protein [Verrucomicrobiota bacterium]
MKKNLPKYITILLLSLVTVIHAQVRTSQPVVEPQSGSPEIEIGTLILSDESALQVLDLLEQLTGKIILRRQDLSPAKINFNSRGSITQGEAVLALESLLTLNGIMLTEMGGRFMKAVPATEVNRHVPEMLIGTTLELAPSQQIYAKLFRFKYLNAEQTSASIITPLMSQSSSFILFPKSNALLITDALINLQRIENIVTEADQPQYLRETMQFVKLNYIQADEMQKQLEDLINGPLKSYLEGNTSVTADERTNQLIIVSHPVNLEMIMDVVEKVDVDAAPLTSSEVFQLRQAKAEEVVPIIEDIISGQEEGREEDAKVAREKQSENANNQAPQPQAPNTVNARSSSGGSESNSALQFSNFVGLSADERTNSIVAYGTPSDLRTIKELIDKIDIPLPQVRIEAIITEVTLDEDQASGFSRFNLQYADGLTQLTGSLGKIVSTTAPLLDANNDPISISNISRWEGKYSLDAIFDIAESDNMIKILSTPSIVVSHNEEGVINVSQSRPFQTGSTSFTSSVGNVQTQVEYRDVGIKLSATPLIGADGSVQLQIEQTIDTVQAVSKSSTADGSIDTQPIIGKREANSTITVNDGDVIILGGLQENKKDISNTYFPIIGRLPVLKKVFSGETVKYTRSELIIFIRPTILKNPVETNKMSQEAIDRLKEREAVLEYLDTGTTGDIYMDGSAFEDEPIRKDKETNNRFRHFGLMREQQDLKIKQNMPKISTEAILEIDDATSDLKKPYLKDKISELWKTSNN